MFPALEAFYRLEMKIISKIARPQNWFIATINCKINIPF